MSFVNLHVHSEYSILDGACRIKDLPKYAAELGQTALALTDGGAMFGAVDFYCGCLDVGIKPIIGCEVCIARDGSVTAQPYHLVLLCENNEGYCNLIKLVSLGYTTGGGAFPCVTVDMLRGHSRGLIALSGCARGEIASYIAEGNFKKALATAALYRDIFGSDNFFLEIQNHRTPEDMRLMNGMRRIYAETGIQCAAANDVHYLRREDAQIRRVLTAIRTNTALAEAARIDLPNDEYYLKSEEEMLELFKGQEAAVHITGEIAARCNVTFEFGKIKLPRYDLAPAFQEKYTDNSAFFRALCKKGMIKRYGNDPPQNVTERLDYELFVIEKMGYVDYCLIVWDFVSYAKKNGIPVGPGRGSGAGCLAAYCIGITDIDPLKYDLLFERFLNPERVSMPDFDIDFCTEGRQQVIDYVIKKYGSDRVSQIVTFGKLAAKGAVRDVTRILGVPYEVGDLISRLIPFEINMTLKKALESSKELRKKYDTDRNVRRVIDTALSIEGFPRNISTHAAGVLISDRPVMDYVPVYRRDGVTAAQYTMTALERLGLLKMDFLGLRNLTIIKDACSSIHKTDPNFDIRKIPDNDGEVFAMFSAGNTSGVFQFESAGMRNLLTRLQPTSIEDLIAAISLYRPGPMDSIPRYIENRRNPDKICYKHPALESILKVTYGCIVYQEQVMEICRRLGGYSYGRADIVRRAMAKKKHDVMEKERAVFTEGCAKNGISADVASSIFDEMAGFASYAFNKSHAAAYSWVAYQTAYLKCHYFKEYMAALLTANEGGHLSEYISECRISGTAVLPPHINESGAGFTPTEQGIRFSLTAAKNVGTVLTNAIIRERESGGEFTSPEDFCARMSGTELNRRAFESLVKCGALDGFGYNRHQMISHIDVLMGEASDLARQNVKGQIDFFGGGDSEVRSAIPDTEEYAPSQLLQMEKDILGMYVSAHPLDSFGDLISALRMKPLSQLLTLPDKTAVRLMCILTSLRRHTTKKGGEMAFAVISDKYSDGELLIFPSAYGVSMHLLNEGALLCIDGHITREGDSEGKIIADGIVSAEAFAESVRRSPRYALYLRTAYADKERTAALTGILSRYPGKNPVVFYFEDMGKKVTPKNSAYVGISAALIAELSKIIGSGNVAVKEEGKR